MNTTTKKPTVAALQRKIERLQAEVESLRTCRQLDWQCNAEYHRRAIDAETRIKQAIRVLNGEDD